MKACLQLQPEFCLREKLLRYFKKGLCRTPKGVIRMHISVFPYRYGGASQLLQKPHKVPTEKWLYKVPEKPLLCRDFVKPQNKRGFTKSLERGTHKTPIQKGLCKALNAAQNLYKWGFTKPIYRKGYVEPLMTSYVCTFWSFFLQIWDVLNKAPIEGRFAKPLLRGSFEKPL